MAFIQWKQKSRRNWLPANHNANSADDGIIAVNVGDVVGAAFCRVTVAFDGTTPRVILGDGTTANGFMTYGNTDVANTGVKIGSGANLAACPGYLYTVADLISAGSNIGASDSTKIGRMDFWVWFAKADPH